MEMNQTVRSMVPRFHGPYGMDVSRSIRSHLMDNEDLSTRLMAQIIMGIHEAKRFAE